MPREIYVGRSPRWYDHLPFSPAVLIIAAALVCVVVGIILFFSAPGTEEAEVKQDTAVFDLEATKTPDIFKTPVTSLGLTASSADLASSLDTVNQFSALDGSFRNLELSEIHDISNAVEAFGDEGYEVGFVVIDLQSGKGLGYNADKEFFSASTIKAPYVTFISQVLLDGGIAHQDDYVEKDLVVEGTGIMIDDDRDGYDLSEVLAATIVHSDNTGYALLKERYDTEGWASWVEQAGVQLEDPEGEAYPYYSARDLMRFWIAAGTYLGADTEASKDLASSLSNTRTSFLRKALGQKNTVLAKAGYEIDGDSLETGALNDAGVVLTDKGNYLIAIMSDVDYDDGYLTENEPLMLNLITALDAARTRLLVA